MKKIITLIGLIASLLSAQAGEHKVYFWIKSPKYTSASHELEISINSKHVGDIAVGDLIVMHLAGDKKYTVELHQKGKVAATLQLDDIRDTTSYYILDMSQGGAVTTQRQDALTGGLYAMQTSHYRYKRDIYEEGVVDEIVTDGSSQPSMAYGSGFLVSSDGYIATNYHVVDGYKKFTVKGIDGDFTTEYEADVVAKDVNNDLALLQLKNKTVKFSEPPYMLRTTGANTGEEIFVLGYPLGPALGDEIKLTTGVLSAKTGMGGNASSYQVSAAAQPGNSGGPLFDSEGNVLGVVNSKIMKAENITYAIKAVYLQALLGMLPTTPKQQDKNTLKDKKLTEKVSAVSKYIYIIKCQE
jgi:S1-C subfamily serine protease